MAKLTKMFCVELDSMDSAKEVKQEVSKRWKNVVVVALGTSHANGWYEVKLIGTRKELEEIIEECWCDTDLFEFIKPCTVLRIKE